MKTYDKPSTTIFVIAPLSIIATSGKFTETIHNGTGGTNPYNDKTDLTRGKQGFGQGMWEDMK